MKKVNRERRSIGKGYVPIIFILIAALMASVLAGCELMPVEEDKPAIPVVKEYETETYTQTKVLRGDLTLDYTVTCRYEAVISQWLTFDEAFSGTKIGAVYVEEGQVIKAGTLVAELDNAKIYSQIETQQESISTQELKLAHIKENMDLDIRMQNALIAQYKSELKALQQTIKQLEDWEAQENPTEPRPTTSTMDKLLKQQTSLQQTLERQEKNKETVTENHQKKVTNAEDALVILRQRLEELQQTLKSRQLWSEMDGTVTHADSLEYHPKVTGRTTVIVTNVDTMYFTVSGADAAYFPVGSEHVLKVDDAQYPVVTVDPAEIAFLEGTEIKDKVFLRIQGEHPFFDADQTGKITLTLDSRQDVLYVDSKAVQKSGPDCYVYVLGEDGLRAMKTVTIGLKNNQFTEIVNGLAEGDQVILE